MPTNFSSYLASVAIGGVVAIIVWFYQLIRPKRRRWYRRPWIAGLAVIILLFVLTYLGFNIAGWFGRKFAPNITPAGGGIIYSQGSRPGYGETLSEMTPLVHRQLPIPSYGSPSQPSQPRLPRRPPPSLKATGYDYRRDFAGYY